MASNPTMTSLCIDKIRKLVLLGELLPGDRIKGEYLRSYLGVGLSPIREALAYLANTPLIEAIDNAGFRVAKLTEAIIIDSYTGYAKIESLLLADAIANGTDEWEARIVAALYRLTKIEKDSSSARYGEWNDLNNEFHNALVAGCRVNSLQKVRYDFLQLRDWYYKLAYPNLNEELVIINHVDHQQLAAIVLERQNTEEACSLLYQHTIYSLQDIIIRIKKRNLLEIA